MTEHTIIKPPCGEWIPVAGTSAPGMLVVMTCQQPRDHDGPHRLELHTPEWSVTVEGTRR